jgi:hypothetical protein
MCKNPEQNEMQAQLKEVWDRAREMIKNENDLINQRLSWMFAAQAFLFAALMVGVKATVDSLDWCTRVLIMLFLLPVIYVGFLSSLAAFRLVRDANAQREFAAGYWKRRSKKLLGLVQEKELEKENSEADEKFKEKIFTKGFPERVHGEDLRTKDFGFLGKVPGVECFTRDHTFPLIMSYAWAAVIVLWLVWFGKTLSYLFC